METNSNGEKQWNCWTEHRKLDLMRGKMKNRAICSEDWLSKDDLVSFQSFVSLLYSKSRDWIFPMLSACVCASRYVCVFVLMASWVYVCKYSCDCTEGSVFPIVHAWCCNISLAWEYLVLGRKHLLVPGLWSHQRVKVKSDSERDKADWHGNGICCVRAKRPDRLTALSLSSHPSLSLSTCRPLLLLLSRPHLHTNMSVLHRRNGTETACLIITMSNNACMNREHKYSC